MSRPGKRPTKRAAGDAPDRPPVQTLQQLILGWVLRLPGPLRWCLLAFLIIGASGIWTWQSLPASAKERILDSLLLERQSPPAAQTPPAQVPRTGETAPKPHIPAERTATAAEKSQKDISALATELQAQGLFNDLEAAESFLDALPENGTIAALQRYERVLGRLSAIARSQLDQAILQAAAADNRGRHYGEATTKYRALFAPVLARHRAERRTFDEEIR
jgi:hypothetical protein